MFSVIPNDLLLFSSWHQVCPFDMSISSVTDWECKGAKDEKGRYLVFGICMKIYYLSFKHLSEKDCTDVERCRRFHLIHNAYELKMTISVSFLNS